MFAGFLSDRKYPAQIVFSFSGARFTDSKNDFLEASIFNECHPDGSPIEVYILTSQAGAVEVERRINESFPHLIHRIESMIISLPPVHQDNDGCFFDECTASTCSSLYSDKKPLRSDINISLIPALLYNKLNMRIVNHDGGAEVLRSFCAAGALSQMNLTLCRNHSLREVLEKNQNISLSDKDDVKAKWAERVQYFFPRKEGGGPTSICPIPSLLEPVSIVTDSEESIAVVVFDSRLGNSTSHVFL